MGNSHKVEIDVHLIFMRGAEEIFFQRRKNTSHEDGKLELPGGKLEKGETILEAAIREAYEECRATISHPSDLDLVHVQFNQGGNDHINFYFLVSRYQGTLSNGEPDKVSEQFFADKRNMPPDVIGYVRQALERYVSSRGATLYSEIR